MARNMATLLMADLHSTGGPEIWSGSQISISFSSQITIQLEEDGSLTELQSFLQASLILLKQAPLWKHEVHTWAKISGCALDGRPYFLDDRKLLWANPTMKFPRPQSPIHVITYLKALLSPMDAATWHRRSKNNPPLKWWPISLLPDGETLWNRTGVPSQTNPHP